MKKYQENCKANLDQISKAATDSGWSVEETDGIENLLLSRALPPGKDGRQGTMRARIVMNVHIATVKEATYELGDFTAPLPKYRKTLIKWFIDNK